MSTKIHATCDALGIFDTEREINGLVAEWVHLSPNRALIPNSLISDS